MEPFSVIAFDVEDLRPYLTEYQMSKIILTDDGCWYWDGAKNNRGYSTMAYQGKVWTGHKLTYMLLIEEIPKPLRGDHQCHTEQCTLGDFCKHRACINPAHIKPATDQENYSRSSRLHAQKTQTHCINNHEFTPENTYIKPDGRRRCRTCSKLARRRERGTSVN